MSWKVYKIALCDKIALFEFPQNSNVYSDTLSAGRIEADPTYKAQETQNVTDSQACNILPKIVVSKQILRGKALQ